MVDVVSGVCGLQAQVLSAAELGLAVRVEGITRRDLHEALWEQRTLVKTYGPRGTIHLLPAREIPLWIAANQAVADRGEDGWYADYGLEPGQVEAVLSAMRSALDGGGMTRVELADAVGDQVGSWARERLASTWADLLGLGFDAGLLCFGPSRGSQVTFVLLDQWTGSVKKVDPGHALRLVCRHFIQAYGPVTARDFAEWFAPRHLTTGEATSVLESIADDLEEVEVAGRRCWLPAGEGESRWESDRSTVLLLPQYDCYLLGSRFGREAAVPDIARRSVSTYKNARFEGAVGVPVLLIDGVVSGVWERQRRGNRAAVRVQPFLTLKPTQRESLDRAAERLARFLEVPVDLSIDRVAPLPPEKIIR
jgi:hypothetical protein